MRKKTTGISDYLIRYTLINLIIIFGLLILVIFTVINVINNSYYNVIMSGLLMPVCIAFLIHGRSQYRRQQKLMEEIQTANRIKSGFLADISHEIRSPMNAITGISELLLRRNLPDDARSDVHDIKQASINLISIINDILEISRIESGKLEIIPFSYMLSSLINDTVNIIRMKLFERPIRFFTNIDGNIPNNLFGDEIRLRQILINLLSNAASFTDKGYISVSITMDSQSEKQVILRITIADTGRGITQEEQEKLFGVSFPANTGKNNVIKSSGLGLAITRQLCHAMGGDISVISESGKGSMFTVIIPQDVVSNVPFGAVMDPHNKKVLVYDGRLIYAESISWSLKNMGVPHTMVSSLEEFTQALGKEEWFYIFSGYGLYEKIKPVLDSTSFPGGKKPPLGLMVEWGTETYIPHVRFISLPVQSLSIANALNGKQDKQDFFDDSAGSSIIRFTIEKARILVVDDISVNLKVIEGLLLPYKPMLDTCLNGKEAVEMIQNRAQQGENYDLIFMDHMMPDMDGIETTAAIREWEQGTGNREQGSGIPIIALTANAMTGMRELFLEKGFDDFLAKPIDVSKLDEILSRWISEEKREQIVNNEQSSESKICEQDLSVADNEMLTIPGVDVHKGIAMTGGSADGYRQVLSMFHRDVQARLQMFRYYIFESMNSSSGKLPEKHLVLFTTQVHAIKSASGTIGAAHIAAQAQTLESDAHTKNLDSIRDNLPVFVEQLEELVTHIRTALEHIPLESAQADTGEVLPLLHELARAIQLKAIAEIDRILDDLGGKPLDVKTRESVEYISDQVLVAEFDSALKTIEQLINTTK